MTHFLLQLAQKIDKNDVPNVPTGTADSVLASGLNIVYFTGGVVAVIVIIVAGLIYIFSRGDQNSVTRAKNMLLYGVIGLIVILLAFVITQFVIGRFQ